MSTMYTYMYIYIETYLSVNIKCLEGCGSGSSDVECRVVADSTRRPPPPLVLGRVIRTLNWVQRILT